MKVLGDTIMDYGNYVIIGVLTLVLIIAVYSTVNHFSVKTAVAEEVKK